jgi:hypothetical protein
MCARTTCRTCKKPTWRGCGQHIEQALAGVPTSQRCQCALTKSDVSSAAGLLTRIFGR